MGRCGQFVADDSKARQAASTKEPAYWDGGTHAWATPKDLSALSVPVLLEISKANFRPIPVVAPSATVMSMFGRLARPTYERIVECARESRTLAALRDALLPRLISGELRVKDAERFVGRAT